jgi:predicted alpha/beta-fold hydrolase
MSEDYYVRYKFFRVPRGKAELLPKRGPTESHLTHRWQRHGGWKGVLDMGFGKNTETNLEPYEYGGGVICEFVSKIQNKKKKIEVGDVISVGISICSVLDRFVYKTGKKIALDRAIWGYEQEVQ